MRGSVDEALRIMQEQKRIISEAWLGGGNSGHCDSKPSKMRTLEVHKMFLKHHDTVTM